MHDRETPATGHQSDSPPDAGSPIQYEPPRLTPLGKWRALTLQQSVPIGPGD